jgi:hypothetical protein
VPLPELPYTCPHCNTDLIFTGTGDKDSLEENQGADFYYCECGKKIVSQAFYKKDGSPEIFYDNVWRHRQDDTWCKWEENNGCGNWVNYSIRRWNMRRNEPPRQVPQQLEVKVLIT